MKLEDQRTTIYKVDPNHPETADLDPRLPDLPAGTQDR